MYSYGILVWELYHTTVPYCDYPMDQVCAHHPHQSNQKLGVPRHTTAPYCDYSIDQGRLRVRSGWPDSGRRSLSGARVETPPAMSLERLERGHAPFESPTASNQGAQRASGKGWARTQALEINRQALQRYLPERGCRAWADSRGAAC